MLSEPLPNADAAKLVKAIIVSGTVAFSQHAIEEMAKDRLTDRDVINVLRGGYCESSEFERGSWRYRMRTRQIVCPIAFRSETELVVITAWRVIR